MTDDRSLRIQELAWRSAARRARPVFWARLPGGADAPIRFLDFDETNRYVKLFSDTTAGSPEEIARDFSEKWPSVSALWHRDETVMWLPGWNNEIGCVAIPFGFLSDHVDFFLNEDSGALAVGDPGVRHGFEYLPGETENTLRRWPRHD